MDKSRTRHFQRKNNLWRWMVKFRFHRWRGGWRCVNGIDLSAWQPCKMCNVWVGLIWLLEVGRATMTVIIRYNRTSYSHYCQPLEPVTQVYVPCESDISCFALPLLSSPKRSCAKRKIKHTCQVYLTLNKSRTRHEQRKNTLWRWSESSGSTGGGVGGGV